MYSARFAADEAGAAGNADDGANNAKLLRLLRDVAREQRTARFRCVLAVVRIAAGGAVAGGGPEWFEGACEGRIAFEPHGSRGFGYDPLFIPEGRTESFAELGAAVKNGLSHRFKALSQLRDRARWG